jgi:hypothetical protein
MVIVDSFIPGMRGQVALRVKQMAPSLPVLMITTYLERPGDFDKPVAIGKPFAIEELRWASAKRLS